MPKERIIFDVKDNQRKNTFDVVSCDVPSRSNFAKSGGIWTPKGRVIIKSRERGTEKWTDEVDTSNLIVYRGRNLLLQKIFNQSLAGGRNWVNRYIGWFAIGTGGSLSGQPLTPDSPQLEDIELAEHGVIGTSSGKVVQINPGSGSRDYRLFDDGYPKFMYDTDVPTGNLDTSCTQNDEELGTGPYPCDSFLIAKCKITIGEDEANSTGYQDINEAGLYFSTTLSTTAGDHPSGEYLQQFARVCFSTLRKDSSRELVFNWYVYF